MYVLWFCPGTAVETMAMTIPSLGFSTCSSGAGVFAAFVPSSIDVNR